VFVAEVLRLFAAVTAIDAAVFGGAWLLDRWWYQRKQRVGPNGDGPAAPGRNNGSVG
jgi:hypothetical protein